LRRRVTLKGSLALQRGLSLLGKRSIILNDSSGLRHGKMILDPDGKSLAWVQAWIANKPGRIHLWNSASGQVLNTLPVDDSPYVAVAFSPDSLRLITVTDNGALRVTEVATGRELQKRS
jgi:WD40 repeat protein